MAPRSRTFALVVAITGSLSLVSADARADEPPQTGRLGLSLGAAATRFQQGTGSPPPCCYEREDWHTWGPEVQAKALYRVKPWLWPSLELGFGFLSGTAGDPAERLRITQRTLRASPAAVFHFGGRLFVEPRVALHFVRIDARFEEVLTFKRNSDAADHYVGAGLGLSVGVQLKPKWALGLDAHQSFLIGPGDVNNFDGYGVFARFTPLPAIPHRSAPRLVDSFGDDRSVARGTPMMQTSPSGKSKSATHPNNAPVEPAKSSSTAGSDRHPQPADHGAQGGAHATTRWSLPAIVQLHVLPQTSSVISQ